MKQQPCYILAIESSCDDTAAAILRNDEVLSNIIATQDVHKQYGGVVPELASRAHQLNIIPVVDQALKEAGVSKNELSAIAFTRGPGLLGSLLVGTSFAKSMSMGLDIPLIDVNHMQAHLLAHFIKDEYPTPTFPFLGVTVSGGHTQLVLVKDYFEFELIGTTLDDAIGEAFDKCGKILGLGYPAGPIIDKLSKTGNSKAFSFPVPKVPGLNLSYSGFKTNVINFIHKNMQKDAGFIKANLNDLCASIQYTLIEIIFQKIEKAVDQYQVSKVVLGGGVSANSGLRSKLETTAIQKRWEVYLPPFAYTTDNAAMIGIVGYLKHLKEDFGSLKESASARLKF